jgi:hypothetical protein
MKPPETVHQRPFFPLCHFSLRKCRGQTAAREQIEHWQDRAVRLSARILSALDAGQEEVDDIPSLLSRLLFAVCVCSLSVDPLTREGCRTVQERWGYLSGKMLLHALIQLLCC